MCGIVGIAGNIGAKEERIFEQMLIVDQLRGQDSTGVAFITRSNDVYVSKEIGPPNFLVDTKSYERNTKRINKVLIGHNRFATQGAVNRRNAHPFEMNTLVGVHNGTLRNNYKLIDSQQFVVDSENLFHHIDQKGLRDALDIIDGAYALVWWDKELEELNFLRNKERTLYFTRSEDKNVLLWASEAWMIQAICMREGYKIDNVVPLVEDMHYRFEFKENSALGEMHVKQEKALFVPFVQSPNTGVSAFNNVQARQNPPNTQQGKAQLSLVKKDTALGKGASTSMSVELVESYSGSKKVRLEIVGKGKDTNGASFLMLMDPMKPGASIRLYVRKKDDLLNKIGEEIFGDIGSVHTIKGEGGFFKVSPHSVSLIESEDDDDTPKDQMFKDHNGNLITAEEWSKKYPRCDWCSDALEPLDSGNRLTNHGQCLCPDCATNDEVTQYVNLQKVF